MCTRIIEWSSSCFNDGSLSCSCYLLLFLPSSDDIFVRRCAFARFASLQTAWKRDKTELSRSIYLFKFLFFRIQLLLRRRSLWQFRLPHSSRAINFFFFFFAPLSQTARGRRRIFVRMYVYVYGSVSACVCVCMDGTNLERPFRTDVIRKDDFAFCRLRCALLATTILQSETRRKKERPENWKRDFPKRYHPKQRGRRARRGR